MLRYALSSARLTTANASHETASAANHGGRAPRGLGPGRILQVRPKTICPKSGASQPHMVHMVHKRKPLSTEAFAQRGSAAHLGPIRGCAGAARAAAGPAPGMARYIHTSAGLGARGGALAAAPLGRSAAWPPASARKQLDELLSHCGGASPTAAIPTTRTRRPERRRGTSPRRLRPRPSCLLGGS